MCLWKTLATWNKKPFYDLQTTVYIQKHRLFKKYRVKIHHWKMFDEFSLHSSTLIIKLELLTDFRTDKEIAQMQQMIELIQIHGFGLP
jgi:hypothetical protein